MTWGKIFTIYTSVFVLFTLFLSLLEAMGVVSNRGIGYTFLLVTSGI